MKPHFIARNVWRDGKIIGLALYKKGALFGSTSFFGYIWRD